MTVQVPKCPHPSSPCANWSVSAPSLSLFFSSLSCTSAPGSSCCAGQTRRRGLPKGAQPLTCMSRGCHSLSPLSEPPGDVLDMPVLVDVDDLHVVVPVAMLARRRSIPSLTSSTFLPTCIIFCRLRRPSCHASSGWRRSSRGHHCGRRLASSSA